MSMIYHEEDVDISESTPSGQFDNEVDRERDLIIAQEMLMPHEKKELIPFDISSDFLANAQNYVRSNWVKEGIWREEWGPPRPSDWGFYSITHPRPTGRWSHEKQPKPVPPSHESASQPKTTFPMFGWTPKKNEAILDVTAAVQPEAPIELDAPSRPINRFRSLVAREVEWLRVYPKDFPNVSKKSDDELEAEAYTNIKNFWKECKIWRKDWGPIPGPVWAHEDFDEYLRKKQVANPLPATERKVVSEEGPFARFLRETEFSGGRTSSPEKRPATGHEQPATSQGTQTELPDVGTKPSSRTDGKVVHDKTNSAKRAQPAGDSSEAGSIAKEGLGTAETTKQDREGLPAKRKRM